MRIDDAKLKALISGAKKAGLNAYAPYSSYEVGAAVMTEEGKIYLGCNVENASFGLSVCAERVAIQNAISSGERRIAAVAVATRDKDMPKPCGACLQVIAEFADESALIVTISENGAYDVHTLADYLPRPFKLGVD